MNIETSRLFIKPIDDLSLNCIIECIDYVSLNMPVPRNPSLYHRKKFLRFNEKIKTFNSLGYFSINLKKNLETIGVLSIIPRYVKENLINELGYLISKDYRNNGFAYEVILSTLTFVFTRTEITSVYSLVERENLVSRHILENKMNFDLVDVIIDKNSFKNIYTIDKTKFMKNFKFLKSTQV